MTDPVEQCHWCEQAEAVSSALRRPACGECAESIAAFYRGERDAVVEEARERARTSVP